MDDPMITQTMTWQDEFIFAFYVGIGLLIIGLLILRKIKNCVFGNTLET